MRNVLRSNDKISRKQKPGSENEMSTGRGQSGRQELDIARLCRTTAEASPIPTASVEGAGHVVRYVNPAFCRLVNQPQEELVGKSFSEVVPAGDECLSAA